MPGVKADLTAVNLTAADKAGAFYFAQGGTGAAAAAAPPPAPAEEGAQGPEGLPGAALPGGQEPAAAPSPAAAAGGAELLPEQLAPSPAAEGELAALSDGPGTDLITAAPTPRRLLRK